MALVSQCKCSSPRLYYNRYIGEDVFSSCGKCTACKRARQSTWVSKLTQEAECHLYNYELELDYNNRSLPRYDFSDDGVALYESTPRLQKYYQAFPDKQKILFDDLNFNNQSDYDYFVDRLNSHFSCIPHASVYDIQLFKKRLNTIIAREVSGHFSNFRSAIVSELGDTTIRPHYHGILYFDDARLLEPAIDSNGKRVFLLDKNGQAFEATKLDWFVDRAWRDQDNVKLGHARVAPSRGHLASYIAKYICLPSDIPSFYEHPALRPIFLTSRKPALGSLLQSKREIQHLFYKSSPKRIKFEKQGELYVASAVPIGQSFENKLFPKCVSYSKISSLDRAQLYGIAVRGDGTCQKYQEFVRWLFPRIFDGLCYTAVQLKYKGLSSVFQRYQVALLHNEVCFKNDDFSQLIKFVSRNFEKERTFLSLHSVSSRVYWQSKVFKCGIDYYVRRIEDYYDRNKPRYVLQRFYIVQDEVLKRYPDYDLRYFYPLTYFKDGLDPSRALDAILYQKHQIFKLNEGLKNKFKNDYFENKLRYQDPVLFNLLNVYYAKKCNENAQAIADLGSQ